MQCLIGLGSPTYPLPPEIETGASNSLRFSKFNPAGTLNMEWTPDINTYLRVATGYARWLAGSGWTAEARALLAPLYATFSEGFDTPYLRAARELLETLGSEPGQHAPAAGDESARPRRATKRASARGTRRATPPARPTTRTHGR